MGNFDGDDALADLLSDGSNDSFFEEPKVLAKRASLTKTPDKKAITDLFGLDDKSKAQDKESDWLGLKEAAEEKPLKSALSNPDKSARLAKKISFEDDNDILNTLGLDSKPEVDKDMSKTKGDQQAPKRAESASKKSALLESIFGPTKQQPTETVSSFEDILKESKPAKEKSEKSAAPAVQKTTTQENVGVKYSPVHAPREGRRSRLQSAGSGVFDPLGLFSSEQPGKQSEDRSSPQKTARPPIHGEGDAGVSNEDYFHLTKQKDLRTKSTPDIKSLPGWLGGGSPVKNYKSDTDIAKPEKSDRIRDENKEKPEVEVQVNDPPTKNITENVEVPMLESLLTQQQLATSHIEYQNTSIALQQQESQLLMALQLKKYEENLAEMQRKQQDILIKQEHQFNSLLERQFAKQHIMENNMRMQQDRINNHIQLLLAQPPVAGRTSQEQTEELELLKKNSADENSKLYEEIISTLRQRQHEEIFLLNESYKKQISLLENSMESVESRLKSEIANLSEQFHENLAQVKKDHEAEVEKYKQKLQELTISHTNEIKLIRENHNRIVEEIKYEYSSMVENIKQVKQTESSVMENANTYTQKLDSSLEVLDVNSKILTSIQEKVKQEYGVLSLAREESLKAKEEEIRLMRATLEKSREAADAERAQLMTLVRSLEMKLVEQSQNAKEERWALQQAASILAARSAAFDREVEFARASLDREKDQIKTLKESMLTEQEQAMLRLNEEKLSLVAEKARAETAAKLNQNYDAQKARTEVDAAIQVAKEAAELTDRERESLHRQLSEVETLRRSLQDKEHKMSLRESELQELIRSAERRTMEGEKAILEAKALENKYNARLRDIQGQLMSLTNREKKLAEEKIALSKERLALHSSLRQVKKCSLCATEDLKPDGNLLVDDDVEHDFSPRMFAVTDPDILRLRYEISEERSLASLKDANASEIQK